MTILIENRQKKQSIKTQTLERVAQKILSVLGCPDAELSIVLVDDGQIHEINRDYLDHDYPTNVISFAMRDGEGGELHPEILGDVVISTETAARDAAEAKTSFESELYFLLLHGILHLLGYDHERGTREDALLMEAREEEVFSIIRQEFLGFSGAGDI